MISHSLRKRLMIAYVNVNVNVNLNAHARVRCAALVCALSGGLASPYAQAQSTPADHAYAPAANTTLLSFAGSVPGDAVPTRIDARRPDAATTREALRAEVVGELRQTQRDSELAGLSDIYTRR